MSVTEREAETAIVEAKKLGESITGSLGQAINRCQKNRRAIRTSSYDKDKKVNNCETILPLLF